MAGAFDWLDTLAQQTGDVLGRAVDAAGAVATAKIDAAAAASVAGDKTPVGGTSPLQTAQPGFVIDPQWLVIGAVGLGVGLLVYLARR
jgi:hypothetical protein